MIAISGGRGFIGSALVQVFSADTPLISIYRGSGIQENGNILEVGHSHPDLKALLKPITIFIHTAGQIRGNPDQLYEANVGSVEFFANILPTSLQQVIHFSSVNVFFAEDNPYGFSKKMSEAAWQRSRFADRLTILRSSWVYGPGDGKNTYPLIHKIERWPLLPLPTTPLRPVYIRDLVELVRVLTRQQALQPQTLVVSGCEQTDFCQIARLLAQYLRRRLLVIPLPAPLLQAMSSATRLIGLKKPAQRLYGLQIPKTWHTAEIWDLLPRETTPLQVGLQQTVIQYQNSLQ